MRTFHDFLADLDRELAAADMIPTDEPAAVAAFLRALLARDVRPLTTAKGDVVEVVSAAAIRRELDHLSRSSPS
ncbi:hypothetical protein H4696_000284 [Amycolatopsis lexingtonensis]|uniref:Uncharacterized protein n=1 Tax=Amycolatopsis lexingtonensis TaxID=218822 RepID=A0ABR9HQI2_9PSEU|nr:hypothetical protein [Amycolatopsis lexingtonensis]MBE1493184.1 hypothetical protein [Amycolatopsis lexingtonensis]